MIPVVSRAQMRSFDAHATTCGVQSLVLMENAGRGAADVVCREVLAGEPSGARVLVVCGTGNNGGDGFVVARHLHLRGARVQVAVAGDPARMSPDARQNHDAYLGTGGVVTHAGVGFVVGKVDVVIDALFGTGLDRDIQSPIAEIVEAINASKATRVALDVPSGLNADNGAILGVAVRADRTVTFGHLKMGLLTPRGARLAGKVDVVDIGVPAALIDTIGSVAQAIERADVAMWIQKRRLDAHKHSVGHVAILAGSAGKIGASLMTAHGAMRAGAGAATIATWEGAVASLEARVVEVMTAAITDDASAVDAVLKGKHAVVMGPGFGLDAAAANVVAHVTGSWPGPLVLDADALTLLAKSLDLASRSTAKLVLTPHAGELARLLGTTADAIEADRLGSVVSAAQKTRAVVLLKGACTLVADPDGRVAVNRTGNPALATAGAGDVLAGMLGAFACKLAPFEAACAAAYVHGAAADAWAARHGDRGLLASEVADGVPDVLHALAMPSACR